MKRRYVAAGIGKYKLRSMKPATLKLCLPVIVMTAQQSAASLVIPPFLDDLKFPVSAIGSLVSIGPVLALAARLPTGLAYRGDRAPALLSAALAVVALCNFLYGFAVQALHFALVHGLNGAAHGAAMTIYLAFFVEALPADEDRHHAMGYYAGSLAVGYSTGGFTAGYIADKLGYFAGFTFASLLALVCLALFPLLGRISRQATEAAQTPGKISLLGSLKNILEPKIAAMVVVHLFLNMIHQVGMVFLPLYGLAVGLTLTQVGLIKGLYSLCNAITRPLSGTVMRQFSHQGVSRIGLPLQAAFMMLVPLFHSLSPLVIIFVLVGFLRAVAIVANTISMVEDVDTTRVSRGVASGIYNASGDVGNIVGPMAGGFIASATGIARLFFVAPVLIAALFLLSLWGCRFVGRKRFQ